MSRNRFDPHHGYKGPLPGARGNFSVAFFTDFMARGYVGLLDWYTVSVALFTVAVLAAHGATYRCAVT